MQGYVGIARDVTDCFEHDHWLIHRLSGEQRKLSGAIPDRLQIVSDYFLKFAEKSRDVFWIRSADYKQQLYLSPVFESIWGISCQEVYDNPDGWLSYLHPDDKERMKKSVNSRTRSMKEGAGYGETYRIIRPDGEVRWIRDQSFRIYNHKHKLIGYAGFAQDITEIKRKNEYLRLEKEKAEVANRSKSNFLAMISHELRTPLHGIIGLSQVLSEQVMGSEDCRIIEDIQCSADNLLALVNDLLDFSKLDSGKMELTMSTFSLVDTVTQVVKSMRSHLNDKPVIINYEISENMPRYVEGDNLRVQQVLVNLLSNAIKFTPSGRIDVVVDMEKCHGSASEYVANFSVKDTGIGIDLDMQSSIFESFFQVGEEYHRAYHGTGLGLAICQQLVDLMGGSIGVESEIDRGSRFWFSLTLKACDGIEHQAQQVLDVEKGVYVQMPDLSVLVVEDNSINQKVMLAMLKRFLCQVHMVSSGNEAIAYLQEKPCDLVFMDIGLPDIDGLLVTQKVRQLKSDCANVPIIAVTAHAFEEDKAKCYDIGMNDFIVKPIEMMKLNSVLTLWYRKIKKKDPIVQNV